MPLKVPNVGEQKLLDVIRTGIFNNATLRLFQNNITPADGDTLATYSVATFTGYANITLNAWGAVFTNGAGKAETDETVRTFTQTGTAVTNTIYGYFVVAADGTTLLYAERNPAGGVAMDTTGKTYSVLPRFTFASES